MSAATWISLSVSIVALLLGAWARLEGWRETKQRRRDSAELRKRMRREEIASLGASVKDVSHKSTVDKYVITITNAGPAVARDITARIIDWNEEAGRGAEDEVAREYVKAAMPVGGEVTVTFRVAPRTALRDLRLWASWSDDTGEPHEDDELLKLPDPPVFRSASFF